MLRKPFKAGAAVIGSTMLAATILTGCAGGPKVTLDGSEVSNLDKAIEQADNLWAQNRASGTASNIDKDSRCYAQASNGVLAKQAICGPIHYLGSDDQVWETMDWQPAGDGKDKVQLTAGNSFSKGEKAANAELVRPDGKKVPDGLVVPEPDTKAADPSQAIWGQTASVSDAEPKTSVVTPDGTMTLSKLKITDRVGGEHDRLKAGDGNKFAFVNIDTNPGTSPQTELAFVSGGKTYPVGKVKAGTLAMALPGDAKDAVLAITYDGLTQNVSLADGKLESKATAYYSGLESTTGSPSLEALKVGESIGTHVTFLPREFTAELTAYESKAGWAPEGKAWLILKGTPDHSVFERKVPDGGGFVAADYDGPTKVKSATVKNVSGTAFTADAKRIDNVVEDRFFTTNTASTVVFEVPAGVGDFSVSLGLNVTGTTSATGGNPPPTASVDGAVPPFELTFKKR